MAIEVIDVVPQPTNEQLAETPEHIVPEQSHELPGHSSLPGPRFFHGFHGRSLPRRLHTWLWF